MCRGLLILLLAGAACDEIRAECRALEPAPPLVELGQGTEAWSPLAQGDLLPVDLGPQGGWHTYGTLRAAGLYAPPVLGATPESLPIVSFTVEGTTSDLRGGYEAIPRLLRDTGDGTLELIGDLLVLAIADGSEADGVEVTLRTRIEDVCGRSASDDRVVTLSAGS